jgi:hypothetical protein
VPSLDEFLGRKALEQPVRTRGVHPKGWEPGVSFDGTKGTITARSTEPKPNWSDLLKEWGFDPNLYQVVEPVQVRTWEAAIGNGATKQFWYYKADIRSGSPEADTTDWEALKALATRKRPAPVRTALSGSGGLVVAIADTQMGKADGGGTEATIDRYHNALAQVVQQAKRLKPEVIVIAGLGDLIENCEGHYAQQAWRTQLNLRDQINVMRRLLYRTVESLASLAPRVVVAAVGGNHGENRKDGKSFTDFADNHDVALFEQVADICSASENFKHVSFVIPNDELSLTLDVCGTIVGLAHGHQCRKGATPSQKVDNWWKDQSHNRRPIGDADILLTGHYHHLTVNQSGIKTHIQAPAMDGGSDWWINQTGQDAPPGLLTLRVGKQFVGGWDEMKVCR